MAKEIISLTADGAIGTEMVGFEGKSCLKAASDIAKELESLGVMTSLDGIRMKDDSGQLVEFETERQSQTVSRRQS
jgi:hypothetical protein